MRPAVIRYSCFFLALLSLGGCASDRKSRWVELSIAMDPAALTAAIEATGGYHPYFGRYIVGEQGKDYAWEFRDYDAVLWVHWVGERVDWMKYWTKQDCWSVDKTSHPGLNIRALRLDSTTKRVAYEEVK